MNMFNGYNQPLYESNSGRDNAIKKPGPSTQWPYNNNLYNPEPQQPPAWQPKPTYPVPAMQGKCSCAQCLHVPWYQKDPEPAHPRAPAQDVMMLGHGVAPPAITEDYSVSNLPRTDSYHFRGGGPPPTKPFQSSPYPAPPNQGYQPRIMPSLKTPPATAEYNSLNLRFLERDGYRRKAMEQEKYWEAVNNNFYTPQQYQYPSACRYPPYNAPYFYQGSTPNQPYQHPVNQQQNSMQPYYGIVPSPVRQMEVRPQLPMNYMNQDHSTNKMSPLRLLRKKKMMDSVIQQSPPRAAKPNDGAPTLDVRSYLASWADEDEDSSPAPQMVVLDCQDVNPDNAELLRLYEESAMRVQDDARLNSKIHSSPEKTEKEAALFDTNVAPLPSSPRLESVPSLLEIDKDVRIPEKDVVDMTTADSNPTTTSSTSPSNSQDSLPMLVDLPTSEYRKNKFLDYDQQSILELPVRNSLPDASAASPVCHQPASTSPTVSEVPSDKKIIKKRGRKPAKRFLIEKSHDLKMSLRVHNENNGPEESSPKENKNSQQDDSSELMTCQKEEGSEDLNDLREKRARKPRKRKQSEHLEDTVDDGFQVHETVDSSNIKLTFKRRKGETEVIPKKKKKVNHIQDSVDNESAGGEISEGESTSQEEQPAADTTTDHNGLPPCAPVDYPPDSLQRPPLSPLLDGNNLEDPLQPDNSPESLEPSQWISPQINLNEADSSHQYDVDSIHTPRNSNTNSPKITSSCLIATPRTSTDSIERELQAIWNGEVKETSCETIERVPFETIGTDLGNTYSQELDETRPEVSNQKALYSSKASPLPKLDELTSNNSPSIEQFEENVHAVSSRSSFHFIPSSEDNNILDLSRDSSPLDLRGPNNSNKCSTQFDDAFLTESSSDIPPLIKVGYEREQATDLSMEKDSSSELAEEQLKSALDLTPEKSPAIANTDEMSEVKDMDMTANEDSDILDTPFEETDSQINNNKKNIDSNAQTDVEIEQNEEAASSQSNPISAELNFKPLEESQEEDCHHENGVENSEKPQSPTGPKTPPESFRNDHLNEVSETLDKSLDIPKSPEKNIEPSLEIQPETSSVEEKAADDPQGSPQPLEDQWEDFDSPDRRTFRRGPHTPDCTFPSPGHGNESYRNPSPSTVERVVRPRIGPHTPLGEPQYQDSYSFRSTPSYSSYSPSEYGDISFQNDLHERLSDNDAQRSVKTVLSESKTNKKDDSSSEKDQSIIVLEQSHEKESGTPNALQSPHPLLNDCLQNRNDSANEICKTREDLNTLESGEIKADEEFKTPDEEEKPILSESNALEEHNNVLKDASQSISKCSPSYSENGDQQLKSSEIDAVNIDCINLISSPKASQENDENEHNEVEEENKDLACDEDEGREANNQERNPDKDKISKISELNNQVPELAEQELNENDDSSETIELESDENANIIVDFVNIDNFDESSQVAVETETNATLVSTNELHQNSSSLFEPNENSQESEVVTIQVASVTPEELEDGEMVEEEFFIVQEDMVLEETLLFEVSNYQETQHCDIDVGDIPLPPGEAPAENCFDLEKVFLEKEMPVKAVTQLEDQPCGSPFPAEALGLFRNPSPPGTPRLMLPSPLQICEDQLDETHSENDNCLVGNAQKLEDICTVATSEVDEEPVPDDAEFQDVMENCLANAKKFLNRESDTEIDTNIPIETSDPVCSRDVLLSSFQAASDVESGGVSSAEASVDFSPFHTVLGAESLPVDNWPYLEEEVPLSPAWPVKEDYIPLNNFSLDASPTQLPKLRQTADGIRLTHQMKMRRRTVDSVSRPVVPKRRASERQWGVSDDLDVAKEHVALKCRVNLESLAVKNDCKLKDQQPLLPLKKSKKETCKTKEQKVPLTKHVKDTSENNYKISKWQPKVMLTRMSEAKFANNSNMSRKKPSPRCSAPINPSSKSCEKFIRPSKSYHRTEEESMSKEESSHESSLFSPNSCMTDLIEKRETTEENRNKDHLLNISESIKSPKSVESPTESLTLIPTLEKKRKKSLTSIIPTKSSLEAVQSIKGKESLKQAKESTELIKEFTQSLELEPVNESRNKIIKSSNINRSPNKKSEISFEKAITSGNRKGRKSTKAKEIASKSSEKDTRTIEKTLDKIVKHSEDAVNRKLERSKKSPIDTLEKEKEKNDEHGKNHREETKRRISESVSNSNPSTNSEQLTKTDNDARPRRKSLCVKDEHITNSESCSKKTRKLSEKSTEHDHCQKMKPVPEDQTSSTSERKSRQSGKASPKNRTSISPSKSLPEKKADDSLKRKRSSMEKIGASKKRKQSSEEHSKSADHLEGKSNEGDIKEVLPKDNSELRGAEKDKNSTSSGSKLKDASETSFPRRRICRKGSSEIRNPSLSVEISTVNVENEADSRRNDLWRRCSNEDDSSEGEDWRCRVCGFSDDQQKQKHVQEHSFHCQSCHQAFKSEGLFVKHLTRKHQGIKKLHHCLLCELSFENDEKYQEHLVTREHTHLEAVEKSTIHTLFTLLSGQTCPVLGPVETRPEWLPNQAGTVHFYHQATPLSMAMQYWKMKQSSATIPKV